MDNHNKQVDDNRDEPNVDSKESLNLVYEDMLYSRHNVKDTQDQEAPLENAETVEKTVKKVAKPDLKEEQIKTEVDSDEKAPVEKEAPATEQHTKLEKQVNDAKKWGQDKNRQLVNSKRKVTEIVSLLSEEGILPEDTVQAILQSFGESEDDVEVTTHSSHNPFVELKEKLDKEFKIFTRYNKLSNANEKYSAFYNFFPLMTEEEQEESIHYLQESEPDEALEYILTHGTDLHDTVYKGSKEKGGIVQYIKSLQSKVSKMEKKSKELENELDSSTKKVYNVSNDSQAKTSVKKANTAQEFYQQRYQS